MSRPTHFPAEDAIGIRRFIYGNPLYRYTFFGRVPTRLVAALPQVRRGDPRLGQYIVSGTYNLHDAPLTAETLATPPRDVRPETLEALHGFDWLAHLRALGNDEARAAGARLIAAWIAAHGNWQAAIWRPDILGERLVNWLTHAGFCGGGGGGDWAPQFFASAATQSRHLARAIGNGLSGAGRVRALKGMIACGLTLPDSERQLHRGLELLESEARHQVLPDGGHYSRNPSKHFHVLEDLLFVREALAKSDGVQDWLADTIRRMTLMGRALRLGDGSLAQFNGGGEGSTEELDAILAIADVRGRLVADAPHSGFQRLATGGTVVIMDAGTPPPEEAERWAHAGTLSFEMSAGRHRIVVNCGSAADGQWRQALRSTAAHSTVIVDESNSTKMKDTGGYSATPAAATSDAENLDGTIMVEASHHGYTAPMGLRHRRVLTLSPAGDVLRGEDNLIGEGGHGFAVRFHLHPGVQALMAEGGTAVLIKLPRGKGWTMRATGGTLSLEDSVYFGTGALQRCKQIVISGALFGGGADINWVFARAQ